MSAIPMTPRSGDRVRLTLAQLWGHALAPAGATATVVEAHGIDVRVKLDAPLDIDGARVAYVWIDPADIVPLDDDAPAVGAGREETR